MVKLVSLTIFLCAFINQMDTRFQDFVNAKLKAMPEFNQRYSTPHREVVGMAGLPGIVGSYSNQTRRTTRTTTKMPRKSERIRERHFLSSLWHQYRKATPNVPNHRFETFNDNFKYVTTSRLDFKAGSRKYELELNEFSHLTIDEIRKNFTGARRTLTRSRRSIQPFLKSSVLKDFVDYRQYMQPVTNQGDCGSCVAHAVAAMLEGTYAFKKTIRFNLSRQMLIDCGWYTNTCAEGSIIHKTLDLIQSIGLERTDCFKDAALATYKRFSGLPPMVISPQSKNVSLHQSLTEYQKALSCNGNRKGHPKCFCDVVSCRRGNDHGTIRDAEQLRAQTQQGSDLGRIKKYVALSSEDEMVSALDQYGPLVASIRITTDFSLLANNPSSIFSVDDCTITDHPDEGYHAVTVVGYGIGRNHVPYWLIRNSWGAQWCEDGHFKLIRNKNMCGIADDAYYAVLN